jgi:hypothetical protein
VARTQAAQKGIAASGIGVMFTHPQLQDDSEAHLFPRAKP